MPETGRGAWKPKRPGIAVLAVLLYALLFLAALYWMRGR